MENKILRAQLFSSQNKKSIERASDYQKLAGELKPSKNRNTSTDYSRLAGETSHNESPRRINDTLVDEEPVKLAATTSASESSPAK